MPSRHDWTSPSNLPPSTDLDSLADRISKRSKKLFAFTTDTEIRRHDKRNAGILEHWSTGEKQRPKVETIKSFQSLAFWVFHYSIISIIPSFQYSIIPTDFALLALWVSVVNPCMEPRRSPSLSNGYQIWNPLSFSELPLPHNAFHLPRIYVPDRI